jgi:hypothetical protein
MPPPTADQPTTSQLTSPVKVYCPDAAIAPLTIAPPISAAAQAGMLAAVILVSKFLTFRLQKFLVTILI